MLKICEDKIHIRLKLPRVLYTIALQILLKYRKIRYGRPFRKIKLTLGKFAIIDPEDFHTINRYKWHANKQSNLYYANRNVKKTQKKHILQRMHTFIAKPPPGFVVDHINHNGLDNRKQNLRIVTQKQNLQNTRKKSTPNLTSKYKGVSKPKNRKKFSAKIKVNGKTIYLGSFNSEIDAAKAYDKAATHHFGNFACINFPPNPPKNPLFKHIILSAVEGLANLRKLNAR